MKAKPILLVEDDENDVFFFRRAMDKAGMQTPLEVARDGQEAIDYLKGAGEFADRLAFPLPCLVLLDLKLPFVMGLDVLKWIRLQPDLPMVVLILSSSEEQADIAKAYQLGVNGYLVKPPEPGKLHDLVRTIDNFWMKQNVSPPDSQAEPRTRIPANARNERADLHLHRPVNIPSPRAAEGNPRSYL